MRDTVDPELNAIYEAMAAEKTQFLGLTIQQYEPQLRKLINKTGARDLLDYGSGHGKAWPRLARDLGVTCTKYDPAIPRLARKPARTFDGVCCIDVLEHVPEQLVDNVLADIFEYATRFVLITTCSRPAKKTLPDGRNMHVTIKPVHWWWEKIDAASKASKYPVIVMHKDSP